MTGALQYGAEQHADGASGVAFRQSGYYKTLPMNERNSIARSERLGHFSVHESLSLVNPMRYPFFAWQLVSHKLCRWLVPFAMLIALITNAILTMVFGAYGLLFALQAVFYGVALGGLWWKPLLRVPAVKLPAFFVLVNVSILKAWIRYWAGERLVIWEPSKR
jgi:hypothetical protein